MILGCEAYDEKVDRPGGFVLPHPPRDSRTFDTEQGAAVFSCNPLDLAERGVEPGQVVDLVSEWTDGSERTAKVFRVVSFE